MPQRLPFKVYLVAMLMIAACAVGSGSGRDDGNAQQQSTGGASGAGNSGADNTGEEEETATGECRSDEAGNLIDCPTGFGGTGAASGSSSGSISGTGDVFCPAGLRKDAQVARKNDGEIWLNNTACDEQSKMRMDVVNAADLVEGKIKTGAAPTSFQGKGVGDSDSPLRGYRSTTVGCNWRVVMPTVCAGAEVALYHNGNKVLCGKVTVKGSSCP